MAVSTSMLPVTFPGWVKESVLENTSQLSESFTQMENGAAVNRLSASGKVKVGVVDRFPLVAVSKSPVLELSR